MVQPVITLVSDFGDRFAESQVELVIHTINPHIKFIVGQSNVTPFSIIEGSFILSKLYTFSPKGSVHIGVIDPGVGSNRRGVIVQTKNYWFVGPDNGLFYPAANDDGIRKVLVINEARLGSLSNTFHGRDIFAKVAALISVGRDMNEFAREIRSDELQKIEFQSNQVVHIDPYGNLKINSLTDGLTYGEYLTLSWNEQDLKIPFCKTFADVKPGEYLLYKGSHQTLELAVNLGSAASQLQARVGDVLPIQKIM